VLNHPVYQKLLRQHETVKNCLCVGLDPDLDKLPDWYPKSVDGVLHFLLDVIEATQDKCLAYKPNISFFEGLGLDGLHLLKALCNEIPDHIPIIMDAKRGDIGNTSRMQAAFIFNTFKADAITVNPLMGYDSVEPFLEHKNKWVFILGLTSNSGSNDIERQRLQSEKSVYEHIITLGNTWSEKHPNLGFVIGATHDELPTIRKQTHLPFLIPGVGAQGGTYSHALAGADKNGICLINVGRQLLYGGEGRITPALLQERICTILGQ